MVNIIASAKNIINKVADVSKIGISRGIDALTPKPRKDVTGFVVPSSFPSGNIGKAVSSVKSGAQALYRKAITNPLAGHTLKSGALKLGAGALGVLGTIKAYQATRAVTSGKPFNIVPSKNEAISALSASYNAPASIIGALQGTAEKQGTNIMGMIKSNVDKTLNYGQSRADYANEKLAEYYGTIKEKAHDFIPQSMPELNVTMPNMALPQMSASPSIVMPGVSVSGGGGMDMGMLALLLGLGAGGGYLLGRRRKKKKYKRRRKR